MEAEFTRSPDGICVLSAKAKKELGGEEQGTIGSFEYVKAHRA